MPPDSSNCGFGPSISRRSSITAAPNPFNYTLNNFQYPRDGKQDSFDEPPSTPRLISDKALAGFYYMATHAARLVASVRRELLRDRAAFLMPRTGQNSHTSIPKGCYGETFGTPYGS